MTVEFCPTCVPSLQLWVKTFMYFITDQAEWRKKLIILLTVIVSACSARTDCGILLPCRSSLYFSSLPLCFPLSLSLLPIIAIWHPPFHCQSGQLRCGSDSLHCAQPTDRLPSGGVWSSIMDQTLQFTHVAGRTCLAWKWGDRYGEYASEIGHPLSKWHFFLRLRVHRVCKIKRYFLLVLSGYP